MKKSVKSFFKNFGWGMLIVFIVFMVFLAYGHINNRWYKLIYVSSGSMSPAFNAGDLICITRPPYNLKKGDIITFQIKGEIVSHRILEIEEDGNIITKGDANNTADDWGDYKLKNVAGIYRFKIPYIGYPIAYSSYWVRGKAIPFLINAFQEKMPNFFKNAFGNIDSFLSKLGTNAFLTSQKVISNNTISLVEVEAEEISTELTNTEITIEESSSEKQEKETLVIDKFVINNNEEETDSQDVILTISITKTDKPEELKMRLNNDDESWADDETGWEPYSDTKDWQLSEGEGEKVVFLQIKDSEGNILSASDSIILEEENKEENVETTEPTEDTEDEDTEDTNAEDAEESTSE